MKRTTAQHGFTIVELMVSITITSIVVGALYSVSRATTETFNQQQRAAEMQLRLRLAMERLRADVARAGYMATPNSDVDPRVCPKRTPVLQGLSIARIAAGSNPVPNSAINTFITPVALRMVGNYTTADEYLVESVEGNRIRLQHRTPIWGARMTQAEFNRVFLPGGGRARMIRLTSPTGSTQFVRVTSGAWQRYDAVSNPYIDVSPTPTVVGESAMSGSTSGCGIVGIGTGSTVSPVDMVDYRIRNGTAMRATLGDLYPADAAEAALKSDLVRSEWALDAVPTEIPGSAQLVGEYAVDFDATITVDEATGTGAVAMRAFAWGDDTNLTRYADDMITSGTTAGRFPQRIRSVLLRLSIRDRTQDPAFGWVPRATATDPLTRFRVYNDRLGAARVRSLTSEVVLPNLAARNLR